MMNFTSVYGIWGDEKGMNIYKYFGFHSLFAVAFGQTFISFFGNDYVQAVLFFAAINLAAIFVLSKAQLPDKVQAGRLMNE